MATTRHNFQPPQKKKTPLMTAFSILGSIASCIGVAILVMFLVGIVHMTANTAWMVAAATTFCSLAFSGTAYLPRQFGKAQELEDRAEEGITSLSSDEQEALYRQTFDELPARGSEAAQIYERIAARQKVGAFANLSSFANEADMDEEEKDRAKVA